MNFLQSALDVIEIETQAILALSKSIDHHFEKACQLILNCSGKVIVCGMGKSGIIGKKIAATLSSTGTSAIFLHPSEALHGDFGMIQKQDLFLAISHSGYTEELIKLLPAIENKSIPLVAICGQLDTPLTKAAHAKLIYPNHQEACPLGLAPTTSTTLALVLGDALAIALLKGRNFDEKAFAINHLGGSIGKKFLTAYELAHTNESLPCIIETCALHDALIEVSIKKLGMTCVVNQKQELVGVFTDGDIRRALMNKIDIYQTKVLDVMTKKPKTIDSTTSAIDALKLMQTYSITSLILINDEHHPIGIVHIHDLIAAGIPNTGSSF